MDSEKTTKKLEARRCSDALRDLFQQFRLRFEEELRGTGVTLPQLRMLKMIEGQQGMSAAAIARECHVTPQTLHTMLARAVREGWIVRGSSEQNQRFVTASLTPSGQALVQVGTDLRERLEEVIWRGVPLETMEAVRAALESCVVKLREDAGESGRNSPHPRR